MHCFQTGRATEKRVKNEPAPEDMFALRCVREWASTGYAYGPLHYPLPEASWVDETARKQ